MEKEENFVVIDNTPIIINRDIKDSLQEVYNQFRKERARNEYLEKENVRLKSEAYKDEELAKMKERYDKMSEDYYRGFPISEKEEKKINEWIKTLPEAYTGAIGGRFTYKFYPTGLGTVGTIEDGVTGQKFTFQELG